MRINNKLYARYCATVADIKNKDEAYAYDIRIRIIQFKSIGYDISIKAAPDEACANGKIKKYTNILLRKKVENNGLGRRTGPKEIKPMSWCSINSALNTRPQHEDWFSSVSSLKCTTYFVLRLIKL